MFICLFCFGLCLYSYIEKQNELTKMKIELPQLAKQMAELSEDIKKIQYDVKKFENPAYLMQLVRQPEFTHLKHPFVEEVLKLPQGMALFNEKEKEVYTQ